MLKKIFFLILVSTVVCTGKPDQPNVIVILADDLGYADVGFHDVTASDVKTPNLDRLAASGVRFLNAYASSPVCSNSRLALSTGRYQQRWGAYYYGEGGLPRTENTIAEMMLEAGYRTMKVGKTHMNGGPKAHPMKHGFERFLGFIHHSWDFHLLSSKDVQAYEDKKKGSSKKMKMAPIGPLTRNDGEQESYEGITTTEIFEREAISFIQEESEKPFYLRLSFNAVHTPLTRAPNERLAKKYGIPLRPFDRTAKVWKYPLWDPAKQPSYNKWYNNAAHLGIPDPYGRRIYLAHLEQMDFAIGNLMNALEMLGVADNTIIFFSSDNGGSDQSYANNGDINGYKYCLMDGGIKVPMLLSWPAKFPKGKRIEATVTHRDLFASLSEITGIAAKKPLDGKSLLPLIDGSVTELHEGETLFWDSGSRQGNWVARQGKWKLVYRKNSKAYKAYQLDENGLVKQDFKTVPIASGLQLYNMEADPGETKDLSLQNPERVAAMQQQYVAWRSEMAAPVKGKTLK